MIPWGVMTRATLNGVERHDTVAEVTGRSGRGTARQTVRIDEALWETFGEIAEPDRSSVLRDFIRWYVREPGAKPPKRPVGTG